MRSNSHAIPRAERRSYHNHNGDMCRHIREFQRDELFRRLSEVNEAIRLAIKHHHANKIVRLSLRRNRIVNQISKRGF